MKRKLFTIRQESTGTFDRARAMKWYSQIEKSRVPFALAINSMRQGKGYSLPHPAESLRTQLKTWKDEFKSLIDRRKTYAILRREYNGQVIEIELKKGMYKKALESIKDRVRDMRRGYRLTHDVLAMRQPNGLLKEFQTKRLKIRKLPNDNADYIGIEIECITPSGADLAPLLPFSKWVDVGGDGSIDHHSNEEGTELRVCMKREEVRDILPGIMAALKSMGARVNKSCGLHVHLDQRNNVEPEKAYTKLVRSLGLLYTTVPESRRRNSYCKRNRRSDFQAAQHGDRYKAINATAFRRYKTIEVRLFGGTLEATKIINWVEVLLAIAYGETVLRCPKTFDTALKYWKLSAENLAWLKARQVKFSSLNVGMPVSEHETEENQMLLDEDQNDDEETCGECENPLDDCSCNAE